MIPGPPRSALDDEKAPRVEMQALIQACDTALSPEALIERLCGEPGVVLLRSGGFDSAQARYSFVAARPFLEFRSFGSRCETNGAVQRVQFGDPWRLLESLLARYELPDQADLPFPLGGGFGYWGYELKNFVEPKLLRRACQDLELPDCRVGFYASLVAFDHRLGKSWIVSTGLEADGSRGEARARAQAEFWQGLLRGEAPLTEAGSGAGNVGERHAGRRPAIRQIGGLRYATGG